MKSFNNYLCDTVSGAYHKPNVTHLEQMCMLAASSSWIPPVVKGEGGGTSTSSLRSE